MARKSGSSMPSRATFAGGVKAGEAAARKPWQALLKLDLAEGETSKTVSIPAPAAGKRIVIEFGTAQLLVLKAQVPYIQVHVSTNGIDPTVGHTFALANVGSYTEGQNVWQSCHRVYLTCARGSARVSRAGGTAGPFFATLTLSGYEEESA